VSPIRPTVQVAGRRLEPSHHALRDLLIRIAQPYEWIDADSPAAAELFERHGVEDPELPVLVDGDEVHTGVTIDRLAEAWNMRETPRREHYDFAVVGAGPAGLAAAVYAAADGLTTVVVEENVPGGQASHTSMIENFFGFPEGIGGAELARLAGRQAERFGAELVLLRSVVGGEHSDAGGTRFELEGGYEFTASVALAAPGMVWRRLEVDGIDELLGRGVYYGAGRSEAVQCAGDDVVVVGAGNSAGQAVMNLASAGARVKMVVRGDSLTKSMSAYLVERIEAHAQIEVMLRTQAVELHESGDHLEAVTVSGSDGEHRRLAATALFLCIGGQPRTGWAADAGVRTDRAGYVLTGPDLLEHGERPEGWPLDRDPLALETSVPGLFAAGDVRHGSTKRVAGAVGEGAMAVALAHRRLEELAGRPGGGVG
jgi:thioredoxin reductase (NADPH)